MKPDMPAALRILGRRYKVKGVAEHDPIYVPGHEAHATDGVVGSHNAKTFVIEVRVGGTSADRQAETLLHEVLHGIVDAHSFLPYLNGDDDEPFVDAFAPALLDFLKSNPTVLAYLMERWSL